MATTVFDLDSMFEDKAPTDAQREKIETVRAASKVYARIILENVPESYVRRTVIDEVKRCLNACTNQIINNT